MYKCQGKETCCQERKTILDEKYSLSPGGESDSRPFSYQENVLPLNYPGNIGLHFIKISSLCIVDFFSHEQYSGGAHDFSKIFD